MYQSNSLSRSSLVSVGCFFLLSVTMRAAPQFIVQTQNQIVSPMNLQLLEEFGKAICIDNESMVVGSSFWHDGNILHPTGLVRIFTFDVVESLWVEGPALEPVGLGNDFSSHGAAVSVLGTIAVVGAPSKNGDTGSVTKYTNDGTGVWTPSTPWLGSAIGDRFGSSIAQSIRGTTNRIAVGAPFNDGVADNAGAVYIFEDGQLPITVTADNASAGDEFGSTVDLFTDQAGIDWLLVGSPEANSDKGEIQLFKNVPLSTTWDWVATLQQEFPQGGTRFGNSVTMIETSDNTLWVFAGAPLYNKHAVCGGPINIETDEGIVEIFMSEDGVSWSHEVSMQPTDCYSFANFGYSMDSSNNQVAIGSKAAITCGGLGFATGGVYVTQYDVANGTWVIGNKLIPSDPGLGGGLGESVSIAGDLVAVGSPAYAVDGQVLAYTIDLTPNDCDGDGIDDSIEICSGDSQDCNGNGIPDECDILSGFSQDCTGLGGISNGIPDECDIASGNSFDCNNNNIPDECDIYNDPSLDCDGNGIIDTCELGKALFLTFVIDGSGSISEDEFTLQKEAIKRTLCDTSTYSEVQKLVVSVIQFSNNAQLEIAPTWMDSGSPTDPLCNAILDISKRSGGTNLAPALDRAEQLFLNFGTSAARELIVITDAVLGDWGVALVKASALRALSPPVRICAALVTNDPNCDQPSANANMNTLANTSNATPPNEDQPLGYLVCLTQADDTNNDLVPLCENCLSVDEHGEWSMWFTDCNSNGLLDVCGDCPGDAVITSIPSKVDVSDLLVVIDQWGQCTIPYPCPGDLNCDGFVDVSDVLIIISTWGADCGLNGQGIPRTVQDCLDRFPLGSLQLQKCLELVEYLQNQGN